MACYKILQEIWIKNSKIGQPDIWENVEAIYSHTDLLVFVSGDKLESIFLS